jgi:hypothetical protein
MRSFFNTLGWCAVIFIGFSLCALFIGRVARGSSL